MSLDPFRGCPIAESHPRRIAAVACAWGLRPGAVETCRVLELGCGIGTNLLPMAARLPEASFVGVDLDGGAIGQARAAAERCGVENVRSVTADILDWQPRSSFDILIAHGLYSWVDEPTRTALLSLCRAALEPTGVAYVSYNALPGWGLRDALRLGLQGVVEPGAQALRARLRWLAETAAVGTAPGALMRAQAEQALSQPDSYLEHEYRSLHHRAFSVREFGARAAEHGLKFLADVAPTGVEGEEFEAIRSRVAEAANDRIDAEQLLDLAIVRQFRATLLVPAEHALRASAGPLDVMWPDASVPSSPPRVLPLTQHEAKVHGWVSLPDHSFRPLHPLHAGLVARLDGTADLDVLVRAIRDEVLAGRLSLPTQSGAPPGEEELRAGLPGVVGAAIDDLARAGLLR